VSRKSLLYVNFPHLFESHFRSLFLKETEKIADVFTALVSSVLLRLQVCRDEFVILLGCWLYAGPLPHATDIPLLSILSYLHRKIEWSPLILFYF
jgi:hypothetical protein